MINAHPPVSVVFGTRLRASAILAAAVLGTASLASAQQVITQWNFNATTQSTANPPPSVGAGTASLIGGTVATYASGSATGGSTDPVTPTSANFGWNTTQYAPQGTDNGVRGVQFAVPTTGFSAIQVRYDCRFSSSSSRWTRFFYTTDGSTFTPLAPVGGTDPFAAGTGATGDEWIRNRSFDLSGIPAANNNPNFAFRVVQVFAPVAWSLNTTPPQQAPANSAYQPKQNTSIYGTGAGGAGGTNRYDMVTVSGTPSALSPIAANGTALPNFACSTSGGSTALSVAVRPGYNPTSTGITVTADLSAIGGSASVPMTLTAGVYTLNASIAPGLTAGIKNIAVTVSDAAQPANGQPTPRSTVANIPITIADCGFVSTAPVVISQVYANAGQGGASLNANYIEIFNRSAAPVSLDGWSVQVTGAGTSAGFEDPANVLPLSGTINPGQYRLIRWTTPASLGAAIPPADFIRPAGGSLLNNLTARVALATTTSPLLTGCGSASVVDLVGYGSAAVCFEGAGAAPGLGAVDGALLRKSSGAQDSNQSFNDFVVGAGTPRNRASGGFLAGFPTESVVTVCRGDTATVNVAVSAATVSPGPSTGITVTADLSSLGGPSNFPLVNLGNWTLNYAIPSNAVQGRYPIAITTADAQGRVDVSTITLAVARCEATTSPLVISEIFGGGGNLPFTPSADYVVIFNRTASPINLAGKSLQYASNAATQGFGATGVIPLTGTIAANGYFLIQTGADGTGFPLSLVSPPDLVANPSIGLDNSSGRIALVDGLDPIGNTTCGLNVLDFVGYGTAITFNGVSQAPRLDNAIKGIRLNSGCTDRGQNSLDWTTGDASFFPNFSGSPTFSCGPLATRPCSPADIANTDGDAGADGVIDNGDFTLFFTAFFLPESDPARVAADIADTDGNPCRDDVVDNGDFSSFFTAFFIGCGN
jgi:hypothetical protein